MNSPVTESFFVNTSGFFDFDLTFFVEIFFFLLLACAVTFFFLNPISAQLNARAAYLDTGAKKSSFLVSFGSVELSMSFALFMSEMQEMRRQTSDLQKFLDHILNQEIMRVKKKKLNLLNNSEKTLFIKSARAFKLEVKNIPLPAKIPSFF